MVTIIPSKEHHKATGVAVDSWLAFPPDTGT